MAVINEPFKQLVIDEVLDKIGAVLIDELPNQATLTSNPLINFSGIGNTGTHKIWKERSTMFNLSELPAINLQSETAEYTDKMQSQRTTEITFFLDAMVAQFYEANNFADQLASDKCYQIIAAMQHILDHPEYRALKLEPRVRNVRVVRTTKGEASAGDGGKIAVVRLEYNVTIIDGPRFTSPSELEGSDTRVKLGTTENGFFYIQNF